MKIISLKKTTSTLDYVQKFIKKQSKIREDLIIVAEMQLHGRGTKNRHFSSPKGGMYLTFLHYHNLMLAKNAFDITKILSLAAIKTLLSFGVNAGIKWPNDIYVNGKKIGGMLITNSFNGDFIDYTIAGIGINVNNDLPEELQDIAISVKQVLGKKIDLKTFIATFIYNLQNPENVGLYDRYLIVLGKKVKVIKPNGDTYFATVSGVLQDGRITLDNGDILTAEEVSIRLDD